jgi:hypothetical protein
MRRLREARMGRDPVFDDRRGGNLAGSSSRGVGRGRLSSFVWELANTESLAVRTSKVCIFKVRGVPAGHLQKRGAS